MPKVLRIHKSIKKKGYEEAYAELLLFYPWRNERELYADDAEKCVELFNDNIDEMTKNKRCLFPFCDAVQELRLCMESVNEFRAQHIGNILDGNAEQENDDDNEHIESPDTNELPNDCVENSHKEKSHLKPIVVGSDDEMLSMARKLSKEQMVVFSKVIDHCKRLIVYKNSPIELTPPKLVVHGPGGVGKSFMINCTAKWTEKLLRRPGDNPCKPKVLILGPTGMAANLIGK